jgi:hypothetical protein
MVFKEVLTPDGKGILIGKLVDDNKKHIGWVVSLKREDITTHPKPTGPCIIKSYKLTEIDPT